MQKTKNFQLDIFGNEVPIKQVIFREKCAKSWARKVKNGFFNKKVGVSSGINKSVSKSN